jgi:hypothetical protein
MPNANAAEQIGECSMAHFMVQSGVILLEKFVSFKLNTIMGMEKQTGIGKALLKLVRKASSFTRNASMKAGADSSSSA